MPSGRGLIRDQRGSVAVIAALSTAAIMAVAALAVDVGSVFLQSRQLQGIADLAALGAANNLSNAQAAANATANGNGWNGAGGVQTAVQVGTYTPDPALAASARFAGGGASPNAAQVTLTAQANLFFGQLILGRSSIPITRSATAASAQMAAFSIGSGLLNLQGGIENALLSGLTGSTVSLSVMNQNALATANVDLLQFSKALQTKLNLTGASFNQTLSTQISTGTVLTVLADLLTSGSQANAGQAMTTLAQASASAPNVNLQQLLNLGPYANQDHSESSSDSASLGGAGISVNALQLATAVLQLAQGGRQVQLSLGASIPGVSSVSAWLAIGQRPSNSPWLTVASDGSVTIQTAQTRLYVLTQVGTTAPLNLLGTSLTVPLYLEVASAKAQLSSINCNATGATPAVVLSAQPSVGQLALAQVDTTTLNNFGQSVAQTAAPILVTPLVSVTGQAQVNLGGGQSWQPVSFTQADIQAATVKSVSVNNLVQATTSSLFTNTVLQAQILGMGVPLTQNVITNLVANLLSGLSPSLDAVLNSVTSLLGVQLGVANLQVNGLRCNASALVA